MTRDEIFALPVEELDKRLAEKVGWFLSGAYHSDDRCMRYVRDEIRKRGLQVDFMAELEEALPIKIPLLPPDFFDAIDAPTELQARCALVVLDGAE